jgi:hypothetical protein
VNNSKIFKKGEMMKKIILGVLVIGILMIMVACQPTADSATGKAWLSTRCTAGWKCYSTAYRGYQSTFCGWSSVTACPYGCLNGVCKPAPSLCTVGSYRCEKSANGTYTNWAQKCYDAAKGWTNTELCKYGCNGATGQCNPEPLCQVGGYRCEKSANGTYTNWAQKCYDATKGWVNTELCKYGCDGSTGQCKPTPPCTNDCAVSGVKMCSNSIAKVCGQYDTDNCLDWSSTTCTYGCGTDSCNPAPLPCIDTDNGKNYLNRGTLVNENNKTDWCIDGITLGEYYCDKTTGKGTWEKYICPGGCLDGKCIVSSNCTDDCSALGVTSCFNDYKKICGNFDTDTCLDWGTGILCSYGCSAGVCLPVPSGNFTGNSS